ncbi:MAG: aminotransferase class III-fold pyridoxal phosphate-dependent enzyme, partial [Paracoccaceae bacterium]
MPSLRALAESTGETAHLSQLVAGPLQTLASAYSARHGMQVMMEDADFLPFHATASGMAVMAFLPEPVREAILAAALYNLTRTTQTNPETLRAQLPGICATGFSETDSTKHQVIAANGSSIAEAIAAEDENIAMQAMGRGAATLCARLQRKGAFDRVIMLGGSMGTNLAQLLCPRWPDPRLSRQYHKIRGEAARTKFLSLKKGYHGTHMGGASVNGNANYRSAYELLLPGCFHVPAPYTYRNPFNESDPAKLAQLCLQALEDEIAFQGAGTIAAFIMEPILGAGGVILPRSGFMPGVEAICSKNGVLLIADEVITAFGRTGAWTGSRLWGVKPDFT